MDIQNVRNFFIQFAQEAGFDPLSLTRWQRVSRWQIRAKKVIYYVPLLSLFLTVLTLFKGTGIFKNYKGSVAEKVQQVFPDLRDERASL